MKTFALLALAALIASSAVSQQAESRPSAPAKDRRMGLAKPITLTNDREVYGAELTLKETTKLSDIVKDPKAYEGRKVRVSGTIEDVCQKKGCFMFIKDGDAKTQVKFTGYSFFVPLDVSGRTTTVEGTPLLKELSEAVRRHYAEDQGKSKEEIEKIKGPETVVMLVVDSVEISGKCEAPKTAESKPAVKKAG